ncbi:hypothetical protein [Streptomyces sp. V2]|uniref:hypothetical protein n=1 Tax=Streptomyces sp. V2 TaxID=1424099 RepID=UPI001403D13D|nr:hypothetical protein [Streptomyces sp. V2]
METVTGGIVGVIASEKRLHDAEFQPAATEGGPLRRARIERALQQRFRQALVTRVGADPDPVGFIGRCPGLTPDQITTIKSTTGTRLLGLTAN